MLILEPNYLLGVSVYAVSSSSLSSKFWLFSLHFPPIYILSYTKFYATFPIVYSWRNCAFSRVLFPHLLLTNDYLGMFSVQLCVPYI
jgi:hypothetical protein